MGDKGYRTMKRDITSIVAICHLCHKAFVVGEEGEGYTCDACRDALMDEPAKTEWKNDEG